MKKAWNKLRENTIASFIVRTVFYLAIMFLLVYLYSYSGVNQPHFIYNEF
ncbi:teichoic acid D-Ala incorporation-associated protein DltX [Ligilactobacillus ceti]|nr:teichoic acid D-Ala incorporation-associated protein DltX [Ligilactobacillus ceti]